MQADLKEWAVRYATAGFPVFPCEITEKKPITGHGFKDATIDVKQVKHWWTRDPKAIIGMPTEGWFVLDVDPRKNGLETLEALQEEITLPKTPMAISGGGGKHFYFRATGVASRINYMPGIDLKASGGYVILPPSPHISGETYRWVHSILDTKPAPVPPELIPKKKPAPQGDPSPPPTTYDAQSAAESHLRKACGEAREGNRNDTGFKLACQLRDLRLTQDQAVPYLLRYARAQAEDYTEKEALRSLESAYQQSPRDPAVPKASLPEVDISGLMEEAKPVVEPVPDELMQVPGYVGRVMDFTLSGARYPNVTLAFCGAMALQSFLCSRKVCEEGGLRPNLYMLALAGSGHGKAYPRKVNSHILHSIGLGKHLGGQMASGQGLEDEMFVNRKMLFQTDEIDNLLDSLSHSKESHYSYLLAMLLQFFTEADEVHTMRAKARANQETRGEIDQPGLVLFGTTTPRAFFDALSPKLLTNGLFSRAIVLDAKERGSRQRPTDVTRMPEELLETARWWSEHKPYQEGKGGNLEEEHPNPATVPYTDDGYEVLDALAQEADRQYDEAYADGDMVRATLWTRICENATRLSLVYACSRNHLKPVIDKEAAQWASRFVKHLAKRMLYLAENHVAENTFDAECLRVAEKIRSAGGRIDHSTLLKRMKIKARDLDEILETMFLQQTIYRDFRETKGRPRVIYRLGGINEPIPSSPMTGELGK